MYQKAIGGLLSANLLLLAGAFCVKEIEFSRLAVQPALQQQVESCDERQDMRKTIGLVYRSASEERVVDFAMMEQLQPESAVVVYESESEVVCGLCREEYDLLLRIVEAEAGGEDEEGKLLVANVVLNRVESSEFPDSVSEVILQSSKGVTQFSPVSSGRIWRVKVSEETVRAVDRALSGEDISSGALYFAARKIADSDNMKWFDENLTFLFKHGGHEFYI